MEFEGRGGVREGRGGVCDRDSSRRSAVSSPITDMIILECEGSERGGAECVTGISQHAALPPCLSTLALSPPPTSTDIIILEVGSSSLAMKSAIIVMTCAREAEESTLQPQRSEAFSRSRTRTSAPYAAEGSSGTQVGHHTRRMAHCSRTGHARTDGPIPHNI